MRANGIKKLATQRRYELIAEVLRSNIRLGKLPKGFVLIEGPIADITQSSRAPVQMALRILESEGVITRFGGRGFLVGSSAEKLEPIRGDVRDLELQISNETDDALQSRGMWELVYDQVEKTISASLIFGEFRVVETELGKHLGVSRTVVRDVLSRLNERGLIRKSQSSHWIAGPLTAQSVRERFAIRGILEPAALKLAAPCIDYTEVGRLLRSLEDTQNSEEDLELALLETCISKAPNAELISVIRSIQLPLNAANRALTRLGLPRDRFVADEYRTLFSLIERRLTDPAADYLANHLKLMTEKSLARLKIVAVIEQSERPPPYLTPLG